MEDEEEKFTSIELEPSPPPPCLGAGGKETDLSSYTMEAAEGKGEVVISSLSFEDLSYTLRVPVRVRGWVGAGGHHRHSRARLGVNE
jgi:hypothetical protein